MDYPFSYEDELKPKTSRNNRRLVYIYSFIIYLQQFNLYFWIWETNSINGLKLSHSEN